MWPVTVKVELALSSQRTMGLLEITFSHACGCRSWGCTPQDSSVCCAGCREEGSSRACTLPDLDGFPHAAAKHSGELQCSTEKTAPPRERASTGNNATASNPADLRSACPPPISFLPCVGHFCPYCGKLKYCHPDALNVLSLPWGVRCCKLGPLALPRKVVADSRQQCQVFFLSL